MHDNCSRCGNEITVHQWLNNTLEVYLFPKIEHSKYKIGREYCQFSFCDTCYPIARKEVCVLLLGKRYVYEG